MVTYIQLYMCIYMDMVAYINININIYIYIDIIIHIYLLVFMATSNLCNVFQKSSFL